jgi:hypothetical protein
MKKRLVSLCVLSFFMLINAICFAVEPSSSLPADVKTMLKSKIAQAWDYRNSRLDVQFLCDIREDPDIAEYLEVTGGRPDISVDLGDIYIAFILDDFGVFMCLSDDKCATYIACGKIPLRHDSALGTECNNKLITTLSNHSQQELVDALRKALR